MRLLACVVLMSLCLSGCSTFGKKSSKGDRAPGGDFTAPRNPPAQSSDPILGPTSSSQPAPSPAPAQLPGMGAILAGRVVDAHEHAAGHAYVRWVSMEDNKDVPGSDIAVSPDGFFTIQGLKTGVHYKLVARAKNGERTLAGMTYTAAPNIRVVIQVKEEFASADTPGIPGTPAFPGKKGTKTSDATKPGWTPVTGSIGNIQISPNGPTTPPVEIGARSTQAPDLPVQVKVPGPEQSAGAIPVAPNWQPAGTEPKTWPPTLEIPGPRPKPEPPRPLAVPVPNLPTEEPPPPKFPGSASNQDPPARVPSCVLVGKQLVNLALNDVNGEPWELKTQRRGKLVLFDFWATYCVPCRDTMPKLRTLQSRFGAQGLEIVGVAYESGGSAQEQAYRVNSVSQRLQVNYRQLLGAGPQCPVKNQLSIQYVPTLILVDENGWILWRHEGAPDQASINELERLIQRKLATF